ncbi:Ig-like domain-containing protein [Haloparvum sedimenti]|uniref:Ig-like domain-containing protein n=1 Tax=Haloparvum sedimenti TaxID=1678448 RepID=UPI00071E8C2B|nr:Ig-like domain-containing protein [Haloparvum sedimenti]
MDLRLADRGQSVQVGAVILFGFLIIGLSLYQATVVPEQNRGVEFNAYQEASEDMIDLQNDVIAAAGRDVSVGTTVRTGVSYPARAIFVNPGPPDNRVTATAERNVTLENVTAVDGEATNTRTFVTTALSGANYSTRDVAFRPDYNVFGGQPVVVTGQQAYRHSDGRQIPLTGQSLLQGDRLTLTFVEGDVSAGGDAVALTTDPVSATERTVTITGENDDPIRLRLDAPPGISASEWVNRTGQSLLANPRVDDVSATAGGRVEVTLNGTRTYELRMAQLEVRERNDASAVGETSPVYIVDVEGDGTIARTNATQKLTVELRDQYNNPVSGDVEFTTSDGTLTRTTVTAGEDGRASVGFTPDEPGDVEVTANATAVNEPYGTFTFQMSAERGSQDTRGGSNTGDQINPSRENSIVLGSANITDGGDFVNITLENLDNEAQNITAMRYNFYYVNRQSQGKSRDPPPQLVYDGKTMQIRGAYNQNVRVEFGGNQQRTLRLDFQNGDNVQEGDFFVISVIIDDGRDTATYFIAPQEP